jgi:hypothetical protein
MKALSSIASVMSTRAITFSRKREAHTRGDIKTVRDRAEIEVEIGTLDAHEGR